LKPEAFENLCRWAADFRIDLSGDQVVLLKRYLSELWAWQEKINLTGLHSMDRILRELLLDSLIPLPHLPMTGRVLDMGSGAGFPAIPLKICLPRVTFHLLEPIGKKTAFLSQVIRMLGLRDIRVIRARIEASGGRVLQENYDVVTTRAATALPQLIEWCAPCLREEGLLVSFQGSLWKTHVEGCSEIMARHHLALSRSLPYRLPGGKRERAILFIKKKGG
jgi:16S rRNA (guanine527-N7)-methyltransferase